MGSEVIALVMTLLSHQADITELLKHIMDKPEDIDVVKIGAEIDSARAKIAALKQEIGQ